MPKSLPRPQAQLVIPGLEQPALSDSLIAGVDEVGRGALFGPVVAAAVILPEQATEPLLDAGVADSKLLSAKYRSQLVPTIQQWAIAYQIGYASVREIDRLNILQASLLAMKRAVVRLGVPPDLCLIDGNQTIPTLTMRQQSIVKGDQVSLAIAAASILAKVWRDDLMQRLAVKYPQYGLERNKGYGTLQHRQALQRYGASPYHRRSFSPCAAASSEEPIGPLN